MIRGDQLRHVDRLKGEMNTEPYQVSQILNTQVASPYKLKVAATGARRGADQRFLDVRDGANEGLDLLTSHLQRQGCKLSCSCVCHAHHRLQSPLFMNELLGSFCVRYSGYSTGKPQCNEYLCSKQLQFRATFFYFFPQWLLGASSYSHRFSIYHTCVLAACLGKTSPVKSLYSSVFFLTKMADLETYSAENLYYYLRDAPGWAQSCLGSFKTRAR